MTYVSSPTVVIQARDDLVGDLKERCPRASLPSVEAFVDWLIENDFLGDKYYDRAEEMRKPKPVTVQIPPPVRAVPIAEA